MLILLTRRKTASRTGSGWPFENWSRRQRENGVPFAIFEYYGDHWMMGSLLPPLPQRIPEDLGVFHSCGADAIVALHFPYRSAIQVMREVVGEEDADGEEYDTEDWAAWLNLYLTGRNMWESAASENPLDDYLRAGFGASADAARELLMQAEEAAGPADQVFHRFVQAAGSATPGSG